MLGNTQSQSLASNINSFLSMFNSIKNPQAMLQQMIANNDPKITQIMNMVNQNGGDPQKLARQMLSQRGINADQLIKEICKNGWYN